MLSYFWSPQKMKFKRKNECYTVISIITASGDIQETIFFFLEQHTDVKNCSRKWYLIMIICILFCFWQG